MVIELENLTTVPCDEWRLRFDKKGKLNVHLAFIEHGEAYKWLYAHSSYDLIEWQIQNNCFDWEKYYWYAEKYCPNLIPSNRKKYGTPEPFVSEQVFETTLLGGIQLRRASFKDTSFKGTWANDTLIYGLFGSQTDTPS